MITQVLFGSLWGSTLFQIAPGGHRTPTLHTRAAKQQAMMQENHHFFLVQTTHNIPPLHLQHPVVLQKRKITHAGWNVRQCVFWNDMIEELHSKGSFLLLWGTHVQSGRVHYVGEFTIMNLRKTDIKPFKLEKLQWTNYSLFKKHS